MCETWRERHFAAMSDRLWNQIESLPSVTSFLDSVVTDLLGGRSVVVLLPPGTPSARIVEALARRLYTKHRSVYQSAGPFSSVVDLAARVLGGSQSVSADLPSILSDPGFPEVVVIDIDGEGHGSAKTAMTMIVEWAVHARRQSAKFNEVRSLLLVTEARDVIDPLPLTDTHLSIRWWWGFPSELEVRLLARGEEAGRPNQGDLWGECVAAAFGCGDASLTVSLLGKTLLSLNDCSEFLREYSREVGIGLSSISTDAFRPYAGKPPPERPERNRQHHWATGQLVCSFEHGVEVHPAALALMLGGEDELSKRLWRSQASALLPVVDRVRAVVCRQLAREYGAAWYDRLNCRPKEERDKDRLRVDPLDAELGLLMTLFRRGLPSSLLQRWEKSIGYCYEIRNSLAHYHPVDRATMKGLLNSL
jgi:hypothetical protein